MLMKKRKDKIKEIVDRLKTIDKREIDALRRMVRNNQTISEHAKHLPKKKV